MKRSQRKLSLHRETLRDLDAAGARRVRGGGAALAGTLTYEGGCPESWNCGEQTGCTSTLSCTQ